jgi:WD40 repeat protein
MVGFSDGTIYGYDTGTGIHNITLTGHTNSVNAIEFNAT